MPRFARGFTLVCDKQWQYRDIQNVRSARVSTKFYAYSKSNPKRVMSQPPLKENIIKLGIFLSQLSGLLRMPLLKTRVLEISVGNIVFSALIDVDVQPLRPVPLI